MTASVVIPAWAWDDHSLDLARGVVDNLRATTEGDYEIVMVYAGIPEGDLSAKVDKWVRIDPPQGWAAACNIGMLTAEGEHFVIGSIDIRVPEGWLAELVEAAGTDTITSPLDYKPNGKTRRDWDTNHRGSYWGGWFCFHRSMLDRIGYLDGYAMRVKADMDWAIKARDAGYKTVRVPVKAVHVDPHHTRIHPDPYREAMRQAFRDRHGVDRFGEYEGLDYVEGQ